MKFKDVFRTLFGIRKPRQALPLSGMPPVGSNIVLDQFRIRLKYPINTELWDWFLKSGWRVTDMRKDRRHYTIVSDKILMRLMHADVQKRNAIHQRLMDIKERRDRRYRQDYGDQRN
ncbi:MAG TPA: hypothetical protein VIE65_05020 [Methylobacter sp.]|jgi:hypothetical protein